MLKFNHTTGYQFDRGDIKGFSFNTQKQFSKMSAAWFECRGKHPKMKSINSDRLYFILKGSGEFTSNNKTISVTTYSYKGAMTCIVVHSPAFDKTKEISYNK